MSGAAFAKRFTELVGEPPLAYVTRWRMDISAKLLRDSRHPVALIAGRVGYVSETAFAKAFRRHRSMAPGEYRYQRHQPAVETRSIKDRIIEEMRPQEAEVPGYPIQANLTAGLRQAAIKGGRLDLMNLWCGQSAALLRHDDATALMHFLIADTERVLSQLEQAKQ